MCNVNTVIIIITINVKKKIISSLKADFWSKVKVVETRPFIVVLFMVRTWQTLHIFEY